MVSERPDWWVRSVALLGPDPRPGPGSACLSRLADSVGQVRALASGSPLSRWDVAEKPDDPVQAPVIAELSDIQAGECDVTSRSDELPSVAGEAVMCIDVGASPERVTRELGLDGGGDVADTVVPGSVDRRVDKLPMPVRAALDTIVQGHQPFPALVVDRRWDLVTANDAALDVLTEGVSTVLLAPPTNALRVSLHPDGMAPRIVNFAEWSTHLLERLHRQIAASGDPDLGALAEELRTYPGVASDHPTDDLVNRLFVPLVLRHRGRELRFFSTIATFGTALDITIAELAIESFFPADAATTDALASPGGRGPGPRSFSPSDSA